MFDVASNEPWYLAQLKPNSLAIALRNLERQRVSVFAPMETRTTRRAGRFITREAPVFPGYVFVQIDQDTCTMRSINGTRGISRLVALGPEPAIVPDAVMATLFRRYAEETSEPPAPRFAPGDSVEIIEGPLSDFSARIDALAPNDRVIVLLDLMGRLSRVTLDAKQVKLSEV
jgi:transcriptional antiterminator RfaH